MSATAGDIGHAAQIQFVRAQKAVQKAEDIQHALNLVLNLGFERFHMATTADGAVHTFKLGIVRDLPAPERIDLPPVPKSARNRRIVLWRTTFFQGLLYASAFLSPEEVIGNLSSRLRGWLIAQKTSESIWRYPMFTFVCYVSIHPESLRRWCDLLQRNSPPRPKPFRHPPRLSARY